MDQEILIVFSLCVIAAFLFGFVGGISLEYHTSKQAMRRQQEAEGKRLREMYKMVQGSK